MNPSEELFYTIALTLVPQIGPVQSRQLLEQIGSAAQVFKSKQKILEGIEGIGSIRANAIKKFNDFIIAEKEIAFIAKHSIEAYTITHEKYPQKLLHCYDPPTILYYKGHANLNAPKMVAIIGTRHHSSYGKQITESIVKELAEHHVTIVSGLAYGIDAIAHRAAMQFHCPTIAALAHGLDTLYPKEHLPLAKQIVQNEGALLTEYPSKVLPEKHHFPARNRIVAGLCDAVIVIESGIKGGSMVTADLTTGYHRELFAVPGRIGDAKSEGCLYLLKEQKAQVFTRCNDFIQTMGWEKKKEPTMVQKELFLQLSPLEKELVDLIGTCQPIGIDMLCMKANLTHGKAAATLLNLELQGIVKTLPGPNYALG